MAKYKIARDGHPYLTQGYPVLDKHAADDVRFCTYQVNAAVNVCLNGQVL